MTKNEHKKEIAMMSSEYWSEEALFTNTYKDKALMYRVAANAAEDFDTHHATVLRRISGFYQEATK